MQYELESYTRQLRALDGQIAYSTVNVTLREVATLTPTGITFPERLWDAFSGGWSAFVTFLQGLILTLVYLWPLLLIAAAVVFAVRSLSRRHRAAHPKPPQTAKARQGRAARLPHRTHGPRRRHCRAGRTLRQGGSAQAQILMFRTAKAPAAAGAFR